MTLGSNNLDDEGVKALSDALKSGNLPNLSCLTLDLCNTRISNKSLKALSDALKSGNLPNLRQLHIHGYLNKTRNKGLKDLGYLHKTLSECHRFERLFISGSSVIAYYIISILAGLLLGLSVAYLAGAAALTSIGATVAVFLAAAVIGALIGYGVVELHERASDKKEEDSSMSTYTAVKSVLVDIFTTGCFEELQAS